MNKHWIWNATIYPWNIDWKLGIFCLNDRKFVWCLDYGRGVTFDLACDNSVDYLVVWEKKKPNIHQDEWFSIPNFM